MAGKKRGKIESRIQKFFNELTPSKLEEMKRERIKKNKSQTLERQLGFYVGQDIVNSYLPTISTDAIHSRRCIEVSEEDTIENQRLSDVWYSTTKYGGNFDGENDGDKEKWEAYRSHSKMLELKYLPHTLTCHLMPLHVENIDEFKKGLIDSLWNCDMCSYSIKPENIKIYDDDDAYFTIIEFTLGQLVGDE
jgi:hypothetical protein